MPGSNEATQDILAILDDLRQKLEKGITLPFGKSYGMVDKDYIIGMLDQVREHIPSYIDDARRIAEQEREIIAKARAEADSTLKNAQEKAARLISQQQVIADANKRADEIKRNAEEHRRKVLQMTLERMEDAFRSCEESLSKGNEAIARAMSDIKHCHHDARKVVK